MTFNEEVFDRARFAKAIFFGGFGAVRTMYKRGQIDAKVALDYLVDLYEKQEADTKPAERLLKQLAEVLTKDDVSPI